MQHYICIVCIYALALIVTGCAGVTAHYQIFAHCRRDGHDFNLACIPPTFTGKPFEAFAPVYMKKLYDSGYRMVVKGYPWVYIQRDLLFNKHKVSISF